MSFLPHGPSPRRLRSPEKNGAMVCCPSGPALQCTWQSPLCFPNGWFLLSHHTDHALLLETPPGGKAPLWSGEGQQVARQCLGLRPPGSPAPPNPRAHVSRWLCQLQETPWASVSSPIKCDQQSLLLQLSLQSMQGSRRCRIHWGESSGEH